MFGPDPIDLSDPSPYLPISYYGDLLFGAIALVAALVALAAIKGSKRHRVAGFTFMALLVVVCASSIEMLANVFIPPLFMAVFTAIYAVLGAWLALQKGSPAVRPAEGGLLLFEIAGLILFLSIAIPAARQGVIPNFAPLVIAFIPLLLIAGDINWMARSRDRAKLRVARHLNRMSWGFVVVFRAPLVELAAAGFPFPAPLVTIVPIALGFVMVWYFSRRYGPGPTGRVPAIS